MCGIYELSAEERKESDVDVGPELPNAADKWELLVMGLILSVIVVSTLFT